MTRLFEVTKRDGAARLGKLGWRGRTLATPHSLESKEDLELLKESTIHRAEIDVAIVAAQEGTGTERIDADVVILAGAARFQEDPRGLTKALLGARKLTNPDSALYVPALATPTNVSLLMEDAGQLRHLQRFYGCSTTSMNPLSGDRRSFELLRSWRVHKNP